MTILGLLDRSMNSANAITQGYRSHFLVHFLTPSVPLLPRSRRSHDSKRSSRARTSLLSTSVAQVEALFVDTLVKAGRCRRHVRSSSTAFFAPSIQSSSPRRTQLREKEIKHPRVRSFHGPPVQKKPPRKAVSRDEYRGLLDYYRESFHSDALAISTTLPSPPFDHAPFTPLEPENSNPLTTKAEKRPPEIRKCVMKLVELLGDENAGHEELFEAYREIRSPRAISIPRHSLHLLLHRLSVVAKHSRQAAFRLLSILDEARVSNVRVSRSEWSSAIHHAGRAMAKITDVDVQAALRLFREMEEDAKVPPSTVTFNILMDITLKAGKFELAELVINEMRRRHIRPDRFSHVAQIWQMGLKGDGDGVRRAYAQLVDSGEIVDTVVLNCVIASLLRAGEFPAAEQVYRRMISLEYRITGREPPPLTWKEQRHLGKTLQQAAVRLREYPEEFRRFQDRQSLGPDVKTICLFVKHHVENTGEMSALSTVIQQMHVLGLPIHGTILRDVFRGFYNHGGVPYTAWTVSRLDHALEALLILTDEHQPADGREVSSPGSTASDEDSGDQEDALEAELPDLAKSVVEVEREAEDRSQDRRELYVGKWIIIWALRAYGKCCGRARTLEVWETLKSRWKGSEREREEKAVSAVLDAVLEKCDREGRP